MFKKGFMKDKLNSAHNVNTSKKRIDIIVEEMKNYLELSNRVDELLLKYVIKDTGMEITFLNKGVSQKIKINVLKTIVDNPDFKKYTPQQMTNLQGLYQMLLKRAKEIKLSNSKESELLAFKKNLDYMINSSNYNSLSKIKDPDLSFYEKKEIIEQQMQILIHSEEYAIAKENEKRIRK